MPVSDHRFDDKIKEFISSINPQRVLDVGCGAGKYADMLKELGVECYLRGVEVDDSYVGEYGLRDKYSDLDVEPIEKWIDRHTDEVWDLVILGDVLEHLKKSDGLDLLDFLMYRTKHILIQYPFDFIQYSWRGHPSENHRSVWFREDFKYPDTQYFQDEIMRLVIIRGFVK